MLCQASYSATGASIRHIDSRLAPNPFSNFALKKLSLCAMIKPLSSILHCKASSQSHHTTTHREDDLPVHGLSETVVGVLGGGQLGKMLCQAASQMAIKVNVLDPMENCPASALSHYHMVGRFDDSAMVEEFAKRCGVLTVEIEHVDVATLEKLEQQGIDWQPKVFTIRIIQDKYLQKVHFSRQGIPLPEFMQIDDLESAMRAGDLFGYPLMIKSKRLAYDGRGNAVAKSEEEISSAVNSLGGYARELYVEKWAPFVKELAVIVVRGRDDSILCYPVVETIHRENICHIVKAPANVPWKISKLATDVAHKAVSSLGGAGVFAVELFLTEDGQILLNEVAPRPHNSGHHTIESCFTSQYEQHLRAVIGLPLGDSSMKTPAAIMYNILGEEEGETGFLLAYELIGKALNTPGASVHWYDKPEMRKQRKMGHVTIVGPSMGIVEARLKSMLNDEILDGQSTVAPRVGIIMGSDSDLPVMKDAVKILNMFDVPYEVRIVSAHRTPDVMYSYASSAAERGIQIIIAGAGGAAHLPGMVAALTPLPVIGVPVRTSALDGLDSLLSIVQMPRGVPVATVAINNATNAGLLAVRMLGAGDADLQSRMLQYLEDTNNEVRVKAEKLEKGGWEAYLNSQVDILELEDASHTEAAASAKVAEGKKKLEISEVDSKAVPVTKDKTSISEFKAPTGSSEFGKLTDVGTYDGTRVVQKSSGFMFSAAPAASTSFPSVVSVSQSSSSTKNTPDKEPNASPPLFGSGTKIDDKISHYAFSSSSFVDGSFGLKPTVPAEVKQEITNSLASNASDATETVPKPADSVNGGVDMQKLGETVGRPESLFSVRLSTLASTRWWRRQSQPGSQNPNPFQSSGSLDFGGGGSFSLGSGGGDDKSSRRIIRVKHKSR